MPWVRRRIRVDDRGTLERVEAWNSNDSKV